MVSFYPFRVLKIVWLMFFYKHFTLSGLFFIIDGFNYATQYPKMLINN